MPPADKRGSGDSTKSSKPRRSQQSKKVGDAGEAHVLRYERDQLEQAGRPDLAKRVRRLEEINEYPGWDITSYYPDGREKLIEVKATSGSLEIGGCIPMPASGTMVIVVVEPAFQRASSAG